MEKYDVIIIGTGPAGLTAGIYASRRNLKTLILGELMGGQLSITRHVIENYPGVELTGPELINKMKEQAEKFGCEIKLEKVGSMALKGDVKKIKTDKAEYECKTLIITTGGQHKKLNLENESKYIGKGISYCTICDGPLFKGKKVAVVGGSDTAIVNALYLAEICSEIYLIHRKDQFRAEEANQEKLKRSNVKIILNSVIEKLEGDEFLKKLRIKNTDTGKISELEIDGLFIEIGNIPTMELAKKAGIEIDNKNFIKVNRKQETNIKGVFAAGDITGGIQQIVSATGEGATAAVSAYLYIMGPAYSKKALIDWGEKK